MTRDLWRNWRTWAGIGAIFTVLGLTHATSFYVAGLTAGPDGSSWPGALVNTVPFWWAKALLLPAVLAAARWLPLRRDRWVGPVLGHGILSLGYSAGHITLGAAAGTLTPSLIEAGLGQRLSYLYPMYGTIGVVYYWAFLGTILAFDYHQRFRERERAAARLEVRASRLESSLARASLDTLRMQLNPHFLFNTLNSISVLAQKGRTERVVGMLSRLSDVLRTTLDRTTPEVALDEELSLLRSYLAIEEVRFGDRLGVEYHIERAARDAVVPSLLLQPLVENALKHGLGEARRGVRVRVEARVREDRLTLRVADSGPGFPPAVERRLGVGLGNTRARLAQLYGGDHRLTLSPPGAGACVTIELPLRRASGSDVGGREARRTVEAGVR